MDQPSTRRRLELTMLPQPDDVTCGPTCLHAVLSYYGQQLELGEVIEGVPMLDGGGTLAVYLGTYALRHGYDATIYTYNLQTFDPTWFQAGVDLRERLLRQLEVKDEHKLIVSSKAYLEFLAAGGRVVFEDLTEQLLLRHLEMGDPIITGLSATYLYRAAREIAAKDEADDIRGEPCGHFVVVCGYDPVARTVEIADPYRGGVRTPGLRYNVSYERLVGAVLLGVLTYDANFLVVRPKLPRHER